MIYKLAAAFILDSLFGDPYWLYHPIRIIGKWIAFLDQRLRRIFSNGENGERTAGAFLFLLVFIPAFILPSLLLKIAGWIHPVLGWGLEVFWMYQILAMKCLKIESMKVYQALKDHNLSLGRKMLSWLVGRDTQNLTEEEVVKAAVETIAENTTDGVTAPMFFMAIGGAPLGFAYKAINTLDSMVGYKNEKYRYMGTFSARMDDLANFIPARITGILMIFAAFIEGYDGKRALKCFLRDRNKHLSPNSAQTESVCAGALSIALGGTHDYFGQPVEKPVIGDPVRSAVTEDIRSANRLMIGTGILSLIVIEIILFILK